MSKPQDDVSAAPADRDIKSATTSDLTSATKQTKYNKNQHFSAACQLGLGSGARFIRKPVPKTGSHFSKRALGVSFQEVVHSV